MPNLKSPSNHYTLFSLVKQGGHAGLLLKENYIKLTQITLLCYTQDYMTYLNIVQIVLATLLVIAILLQAKCTGLSGVFGGEGNIFRTKRGFEKILFYATIVLAVLFFAAALANVYFSK